MEINQNDLITEVTTKIVEDSIKYVWEKVQIFFRDLQAADAIRYGDAYVRNLKNTYKKYSKIKTILYRQEPKELYDF